MKLRVSGGVWRGRRLEAPPDARPTQERVREALFSRWGERVVGAAVLDLFAASGAVGIEALSRGAGWSGFVDDERSALLALRRNLEAVDAGQRAGVLGGRLPAALEHLPRSWPRSFDLIFADPPYELDDDDELLRGTAPLLGAGGELVLEHAARRTVTASAGLVLLERRQYGETALSIFAAQSGSYPRPCSLSSRKNDISSR